LGTELEGESEGVDDIVVQRSYLVVEFLGLLLHGSALVTGRVQVSSNSEVDIKLPEPTTQYNWMCGVAVNHASVCCSHVTTPL